MLCQQSTPELVTESLCARVASSSTKHSVAKPVLRVSHGAPPLNRHADLGLVIFDRQIRNLVGKIVTLRRLPDRTLFLSSCLRTWFPQISIGPTSRDSN